MKKQSNLSKLMEYAGNFKYLTYASWVLSAISALIALLPFIYVWKIIREVLEIAPDFSQAQYMVHNGIMAVIFAFISLFVYICALMCSHLSAFRIASNIRIKAMHHIVTLPLGFMDSFGSGRMRRIINESSAATETYLAHQLPDRAGALVTPVGLLFLLLFFDWRMGILSLVPIALAFIIMMCMTGKGMQEKMKEYQNALERMSNEAVEYVRGIPVVKTFGQSVFSFRRFKAAIDDYSKWAIAYTKELRIPMIFYTTIINGVFAFLIFGVIALTRGGVNEELLLNFIFYIIITPIITVTLTKIMFSSENTMIVNDAIERIEGVLNLEPLSETDKSVNIKDNSVELKNVTFSYDGKNDVINNVSLKINAGETAAFVGPSGGGKSTLASLISRFFDVKKGSIFIGGVNIKDIPKKELMNKVAFVFQNSKLLKMSVLENVRLSRPEAAREQVIEALKQAQCMDIVEKLPKGIDTVIGTKGVFLSGGEQQRLAIARVMLKDAPIVILDEATAFADPDNESRVQQAFSNMAKGRTVIMIAHRLSTVVDADKIFVVKDGKINEQGSHIELLNNNSIYANMWNNYQTSVQWKVGKEN
ncbi:MAG: ABC transporter ATP-binding protein [Clostridia bacterium]|nr:ABC transporter ATP-binding protein [Clostridia bacterium]